MNQCKEKNELEIARKEAFTLQGSSSGMKYIGATEDKNGKVHLFYKDNEGNYWFETKFRAGDKLISEEEHIFGRKITKQRYIRRSGKY